MQSHVDVKVPTVAEYGSALEQFLAAGYEIQITELDFTIDVYKRQLLYKAPASG